MRPVGIDRGGVRRGRRGSPQLGASPRFLSRGGRLGRVPRLIRLSPARAHTRGEISTGASNARGFVVGRRGGICRVLTAARWRPLPRCTPSLWRPHLVGCVGKRHLRPARVPHSSGSPWRLSPPWARFADECHLVMSPGYGEMFFLRLQGRTRRWCGPPRSLHVSSVSLLAPRAANCAVWESEDWPRQPFLF